MHEIAEYALAALEKVEGQEEGGYDYSEHGILFIHKQLSQCKDGKDFGNALKELLGVSIFLKDQGHPKASATLTAMLEEIVRECFGEEVGKQLLQNAGAAGKQQILQSLIGGEGNNHMQAFIQSSNQKVEKKKKGMTSLAQLQIQGGTKLR
ncbi:MAG: hypothetical protein AAGJ35_11945 [Myxococcota bacterium]